MCFGNLELDTEASEIRALNTIGLAHREVRLLSCLLANTDQEMTAEDLLKEVWNNEPADAETVWMYVSFLKAKLQSVQANVTIEGDRNHSFRLKEF
jgi:DNA-binding response OmpR family regulator